MQADEWISSRRNSILTDKKAEKAGEVQTGSVRFLFIRLTDRTRIF